MSNDAISTVAFRSNLQPVEDNYRFSKQFLASVHDVVALEIIHKAMYPLTPLQRQEYNDVAMHCAYAYKDDYPFGTIRTNEGTEKVVCKCTNTSCIKFRKCRPDFDPLELLEIKENNALESQRAKVEALFSALNTTAHVYNPHGNSEAARVVFSVDTEPAGNNSSSTTDMANGPSAESGAPSARENIVYDESKKHPKESLSQKAIISVQNSVAAYCKYLSANDSGETGGHQSGILISNSAKSMLFTDTDLKNNHICKKSARIKWQGEYYTESCFTWYESKKELRITKFGQNFPFLSADKTGALFVLSKQYSNEYEAFILDSKVEIQQFFVAFNLLPDRINQPIPIDQFVTGGQEERGIAPVSTLDENSQYIATKQTGSDIHEKPVDDASLSSFVTVSQVEIIQSPTDAKVIVNAGPGTGKTWTLIEKVKYMLSNLEIAPENILVLCFSRAAVEVVRNRLASAADSGELPLNWHQVEVRTFDSFATYLLAWLKENIPQLLPPGFLLETASYDQRIHAATYSLNSNEDLLSGYEHIIVDEVQDLVGVRAELVLAILKGLPEHCGFTLLGDTCQAIYDYLALDAPSVLSSEKFYREIFHEYRDAAFYSLGHNYRQSDSFGELSIPYRKALLSEDPGLRTAEAKKIYTTLSNANIDLRKISQEEIAAYLSDGTLGILSRTNGLALQISSWLKANEIPHTLQGPTRSQDLAAWIARTLTNCETVVVGRNEFEELFTRYYPKKALSSSRYWDALVSTQKDQTKTHYEIEDILRGVLQNARSPLLFEEPSESIPAITVSNIHRAKGREFDTVLVLQDVLENMTGENQNDLLEHKVCYVALTRPKKHLQKVCLKPQYIYISRDDSRRCFRAGGFLNKKYLSHFEVGKNTDFDEREYARTTDRQRIIQALNPDTRLKLIKCPEEDAQFVQYKIVLEENERTVLGFTKPAFSKSLECAIQRIYKNNKRIAYKYYPNVFGEVYLNRLTTCISPMDYQLKGGKKYGSISIWYGLAISGFAQMEKDRY